MRTTWIIVGVLLAIAGLIWTLQGFDVALAPKSFMTGSGAWVVLGLVTFVLGLALAVWSWRQG